MSIETLVWLGVVYVIGFYITAFFLGIGDAMCGLSADDTDWFMSVWWPICIPILVVVGLEMLFKFSFAKLKSRFPAMVKFVQRTWKRVRTAIFTVSLVFRPVKLGEIVGKRICRRCHFQCSRHNMNERGETP